jgi:signal transduction histidine kinase
VVKDTGHRNRQWGELALVRSLTLRLALLTALWVTGGLATTGWFVAGIAEQQIQAAADARLMNLMDAVIAVTTADSAGHPRIGRAPSGGDFERPLSGEYWRIMGPSGVVSSRSVWDAQLPQPPIGMSPGVPLTRDIQGPRNQWLRLMEQTIKVPGGSVPLVVQVAVSREATDAEVRRLRHGLGLAFGLLGVGLVGGVVAQVVWGLRPLRVARRALSEVRVGRRDRLALAAPSEIAPLVEEIDELIAQNHMTVQRARAHVGNLAHALKTPVAVLANELRNPNPSTSVTLGQITTIERIIYHHLARARSSALVSPQSLAGRSSPVAVAEEVAMALRQLQAERALTIAVDGDAALRVRVDRQDLIEILGNLMENACKWARSRIEVRVTPAERGSNRAKGHSVSMIAVVVEDDGPGLPEGHSAEEAVTRGIRLDETAPGTGLGLAIVADLATLHGGFLSLGLAQQLSGASARLDLPTAAAR